MRLTNDLARSLTAKADTLFPDDDVPNFYLRVRPTGSRSYIIQWRSAGRQRRATIGKAGILTLDEARKRARKMLVGIDEGHDPVAAKHQSRVEDRQLFGTLVAEYLAARASELKPRSLEAVKLHLEQHFKGLHPLPIARISRAMVAAELRTIRNERGNIAANRARSSASALFGWLIGEGLLESNPVVGTNSSNEGTGRERVLTDAELVAIWSAAPAGDYGRIVKLLILTGQRRDEVSNLRWDEVKDSMISLPSSRTKNARPHDVPLSPQALAVLDEVSARAGRDSVFGRGASGFSNFSASKANLDEASGVTDWTLHDLRRTCATRMADLGVQPHIIEAVLNHVCGHKGGVAGVYNRSVYAAEKRAALILWGQHVQDSAGEGRRRERHEIARISTQSKQAGRRLGLSNRP